MAAASSWFSERLEFKGHARNYMSQARRVISQHIYGYYILWCELSVSIGGNFFYPNNNITYVVHRYEEKGYTFYYERVPCHQIMHENIPRRDGGYWRVYVLTHAAAAMHIVYYVSKTRGILNCTGKIFFFYLKHISSISFRAKTYFGLFH